MTFTRDETGSAVQIFTASEVLEIVIAAGGQIVVDDNHRTDASFKMLSSTYRELTQETIYTSIPLLSYGRCPHCGGKVTLRERRINGNDTCEDGHVYPSRCSVVK